MLTHEILESQAVVELPAREMMGFFSLDVALVSVRQTNANFQWGAVNVNAGQLNASEVYIYQ